MAAPTSAPVFKDDIFLGVIGNNIFLNSLSGILASFKSEPADRLIIVDEQHQLVADSALAQPFDIVNGKTVRFGLTDLEDNIASVAQQALLALPDGIDEQLVSSEYFEPADSAYVFNITIPDGPNWKGFVYRDNKPLLVAQAAEIWKFFAVQVAGLLLIFLTLYALIRYVTKPIVQMSRSAERMAEGDLEQSVEYHSADELGLLANAFNSMATKLNETINALTEETARVRAQESELEQTTHTLLGQKNYLANLQDLVGDGFFEWDFEKDRLVLSPNFLATLAWQPSMPPNRWDAIIYPPDYQQFKALLDQFLASNLAEAFSCEVRVSHGDQEAIWVQIRANVVALASERSNLLVGSIQDINVSYEQRLEIKQLHERLSLAFKASQSGVWDWHVDRDELIWDDQMYRLYGIRKEDFSRAYDAWRTAVHPDDQARATEEVAEALRGEKNFDSEFRVVWPNGEIRYIKAFADVITDETGKPVRMVGINWDETKVVENQQRLARANDELTQFAYRSSHDIRAPLLSGLGLIDIIEEDLADGDYEEVQENLERMRASLQRLVNLVSDILSLSRAEISDTPPSRVDLRQLIEGVAAELELGRVKGVSFSMQVEAVVSQILVQDLRLKQILRNLIENSVKYSDQEKVRRDEAWVRVTADSLGSAVMITVSDNGVGIPEHCHDKVFEMFSRFHPNYAEGSGLGMAIVDKHCKAMQAWIRFNSSPAGTEFILTIPNAVPQSMHNLS